MDHKPPEKIEHLLDLKVMRLTRPSLSSPLIVTNEIKDLPENILNNDLKNDITSVEGSETLAVGQFLLTPQSFGNIYLGESFVSYISVHNDSGQVAKNVNVKADLQTANKRVSLANFRMNELTPENAMHKVIHHEVNETGSCSLVCEVSYTTPAGDPMSFSKNFTFQVAMPLDLKTKFCNAESDEVFLEAQVQNITAGPINLEKVLLISSQMFKVSSLNETEESKPGEGLLQPKASRKYLYCLSPTYSIEGGNFPGAKNLGRLDITWRSALGEKGRLQTSELEGMAPNFGDIRLSVHNLPNIVKIEEPFTFTCKIANVSKASMDLILGLEKLYPDLLWIGISGKHLGRLESGRTLMVDLTMVPLSAGLHNISGIRLKDTFSNSAYDYDEVAQIFVT